VPQINLEKAEVIPYSLQDRKLFVGPYVVVDYDLLSVFAVDSITSEPYGFRWASDSRAGRGGRIYTFGSTASR
jgi:hypothetical protein